VNVYQSEPKSVNATYFFVYPGEQKISVFETFPQIFETSSKITQACKFELCKSYFGFN
jgi:hypothetical protein